MPANPGSGPTVTDVPKEEVESPIDTSTILEEGIDEYNLNDIHDWSQEGYDNAEDLETALDSIVQSGWNWGSTSNSGNLTSVMTNSINGIFGIPYQFSPTVDIPVIDEEGNTTNVGQKYIEKILSVMPVLFLTPGEPLFMPGFGESARNTAAEMLMNSQKDDESGIFDGLGDSRYYSFRSNFPEFQKYVNISVRALAQFMGIGHVIIPGYSEDIRLDSFNLEALLSNDFHRLFGANTTIPFFLDAETSISESFGNDTTESMLSQKVNQFSDTAREIQFLMGSHDFGGLAGNIKNAFIGAGSNLMDAVGDVATDVLGAVAGKGLVTRVTNELTTVVTGGKIVFPEIWSGSSFSKNYDITIKLRSPDPDPVSILLNVYLPIILLISMAAPRQLNNSANSYESPFLVRATYKSIFNCDLGIISSLNITKGGEDKWNVMGMPIQADVTVSIKDLYSTMFISKTQGLLNNTAQMDYLALMAGIDMNEIDVLRNIKLATLIYSNKPRDFLLDGWANIKDSLNKAANRVIGTFADTRFVS